VAAAAMPGSGSRATPFLVLATAALALLLPPQPALAAPGCLTSEGNLTFDSNATLVAEIGGYTPCTEHDQFSAGLTLRVQDARLELVLLPGFTPTLGDRFELLRFGTLTGSGFATVDETRAPLPPGLAWNASELMSTGELSVELGDPTADSDEDGVSDGDEIGVGTDPFDPDEYPWDPEPFLSYGFQGTLTADQVGAPPLIEVDPAGAATFETADVFGEPRTVYRFGGSASPSSNQGGLQIDTTARLPADDYTLQLVFAYDAGAGTFRHIIETKDRTSDLGLYTFSDDFVNIFPGGTGEPPKFVTGAFQRLVIVKEAATSRTKVWLENTPILLRTGDTTLDIDGPEGILSFFLDNDVGDFQTDWAPGRIAYLRIWDRALSDAEATALDIPPQSPAQHPQIVPALPWSFGAAFLAGVLGVRRRLGCG
jgi:hypothetical protein